MISRMEVTNLGPVQQCSVQPGGGAPGDAGLVLHGNAGTEFSFAKGFLFTLALIAAKLWIKTR